MITLLQIALSTVEAFHDKNVISGIRPDQNNVVSNKRWHRWDAMQWVLIHAIIAYAFEWIFLFTGLAIRLVLLQLLLNKLRNLPLSHLGNGPVDRFCLFVFGRKWTVWIKAALLVTILIWDLI
jgi:hypothetical protein